MTELLPLTLRPATLEDAKMLLDWRNDPQTRQASLNTEEVTLDQHLRWLRKTLDDDSKLIFIAELNTAPAGIIRADRTENNEYNLSWTVSPVHRGQGIATQMLKLLTQEQKGPFIATIKPDNLASQQVATSAGMVLNKTEDALLYYRKD